MLRKAWIVSCCLSLLLLATAAAADQGNLLRNGRFQDDWLSLLPETKNHHWCYSSEFYHRRDFNPDGWQCKGSWRWLDADAAPGDRRLVLAGPNAELVQRVNWVAVHDERKTENFPDAGGFPSLVPERSTRPLTLVRDLVLKVKLKGQDVPPDAGQIEVGYCMPAAVLESTPLNMIVPPLAAAAAALPGGSYESKTIEARVSAAEWLAAVEKLPKDPQAKPGTLLPVSVSVALRYRGASGSVEVQAAELVEAADPAAANLIAHGGFETLDKDGYPTGWDKPVKYRYFPPGRYYIFNTWHNAGFDNCGPVATDELVVHGGRRSLAMIVPQGDEKAVTSAPIILNQDAPRLVEVSAWVKTDCLTVLQIDAVDEKDQRLDGFNSIHKAPVSIGSDQWRLVRQVFRPRTPLKSIRLMLCARGVNGYTLDDTGMQPQNNVVGTAWWDDVRVSEPESTAAELAARKVTPAPASAASSGVHLADLDFDERLLGDNQLTAMIVNPGAAATLQLNWEHTNPSGKVFRASTTPIAVPAQGSAPVQLTYTLDEPCREAYTHVEARLSLVQKSGKKSQTPATSTYWLSTWTSTVDLELGALYLAPEAKQMVRMNLGYSATEMAKLTAIRLELIRRGSGEVLKTWEIPATPAAVVAQREKIPVDLREDFTNLLLTDLDVSSLPLMKFDEPARNWLIRATVLGIGGKKKASVDSAPFCRLDHQPPQPAIASVAIKNNLLHVNGQPWMPWGAVYGHVPVTSGPADPGAGKYRDLHNVPPWSLYDRFSAEPYTRKQNDLNCMRYVAGSITDPKVLEKRWQDDNLYCSSAFVVPDVAFSLDELKTKGGGAEKLEATLANVKSGPMIVSSAVGIEEAFGLFHAATPEQVAGLGKAVELVREKTGKPVMVGHGGYWTRLEFERAPFFDIYDPETEPFFPANLHTDLAPLMTSEKKVAWLRPQMYEDVPYERWRFHVFVELMRGCRGWQIAHGPGDASLFRGLHGEMEMMKKVVASTDPGPRVEIKPWLEHLSRRVGDKLYIVAATTHGLTLGKWRNSDTLTPAARSSRLTESAHELRDEANAYAIGTKADMGPSIHGIQNLPNARSWPTGSKLTQSVRLDKDSPPRNIVLLIKADGRWTSAAAWGKFDATPLRSDSQLAYWFLSSFYRHSKGFLGWDTKLVGKALEYIPDKVLAMGPLPAAGQWLDLDLQLEKVGAAGKLVDGVAFLHEGGRVNWGSTSLVDSSGEPTLVWGEPVGVPAEKLKEVRIEVAGLKVGGKARVLLEDREVTTLDGGFVDDFRGEDLYQRFGGGPGVGYGDTPVALHIYELNSPK